MALALLVNIPFLFYFSQKTVRLGALSWDRQEIVRLTGERWELAGMHVNVDKLELLFAWRKILSTIFSEGEKVQVSIR